MQKKQFEHLLLTQDSGSAAIARQEIECRRLMGEYDMLCGKLFSYTESVALRHDPTRFLRRTNE